MDIEFDSERDCSKLNVVQDILVENFNDGFVLIWQCDGTNEVTHCVAVPTHMVERLKAALGADEGEVLVKCLVR